jgi:hypothetical protein
MLARRLPEARRAALFSRRERLALAGRLGYDRGGRARAERHAGGNMTASSAWREPRPPIELKTVRCKACRRRLGDFAETARGEIVCPKCSVMNALPRR